MGVSRPVAPRIRGHVRDTAPGGVPHGTVGQQVAAPSVDVEAVLVVGAITPHDGAVERVGLELRGPTAVRHRSTRGGRARRHERVEIDDPGRAVPRDAAQVAPAGRGQAADLRGDVAGTIDDLGRQRDRDTRCGGAHHRGSGAG